MKKLAALFALLALTACETIPKKGAFVPYRTVLAETRDRPYECAGFDAASGTCEAIGRSRLRGTIVTTESWLAFSEGLPATVYVKSRHRLEADGRVCGIVGEPQIRVTSDGSAETNAAIADLFYLVVAGAMAEACASYFRPADGSEGYLSEVTFEDGASVGEPPSTSRFFSERKPLRPIEM